MIHENLWLRTLQDNYVCEESLSSKGLFLEMKCYRPEFFPSGVRYNENKIWKVRSGNLWVFLFVLFFKG